MSEHQHDAMCGRIHPELVGGDGSRLSTRVKPASLNLNSGVNLSPLTTGAIVVIGIVCLALPLVSMPLALLILASAHRRGATMSGIVAMLAVTLMFGWMNAGKVISGDWAWYVEHYQVLRTLPLNEYLGRPFGAITPRLNEPFYYATASTVSKLTGANIAALAWVVTLLIYIPIGVASLLLARSLSSRPVTVVASVVCAMMAGLTFTLSTQLVRQEIAAGLMGLGFVLLAFKRHVPGLVVLSAAAFTHQTALIPVSIVLVAVWLRSTLEARLVSTVTLFGIYLMAGSIYLGVGGEGLSKNDGEISSIVLVLDAVLAIGFMVATRSDRNPVVAALHLCIPALYGFLVGVSSEPLPLLRMYFYLEVLRALMIGCLVARVLVGRYRHIQALAATGLAILYVELRINLSPYDYGGGLIAHMLFPLNVLP